MSGLDISDAVIAAEEYPTSDTGILYWSRSRALAARPIGLGIVSGGGVADETWTRLSTQRVILPPAIPQGWYLYVGLVLFQSLAGGSSPTETPAMRYRLVLDTALSQEIDTPALAADPELAEFRIQIPDALRGTETDLHFDAMTLDSSESRTWRANWVTGSSAGGWNQFATSIRRT